MKRYIKRIMSSLSKNTFRTLNYIELDKSEMLHNVESIQNQHPGYAIMPVLKANAYGHGLKEVAAILNDAKCDLLAVDGYFEAAQIRYITKHRILVLGYILPENVHLLDTKRCSFVVQDKETLEAFGRLRKPVQIHLELNTGMNRLGLQPYEVDAYLKTMRRFPRLQLEGVMSHLADADNEVDDEFTHKQLTQFDEQVERIVTQGFTPRYIHLAQTAGSTKISSKYTNALRLGIGLYGINPLQSKDKHFQDLQTLQPILTLKSTIIKTMSLNKGEAVGYNGTFIAKNPMQIGILPIGYYEGVPRELSNVGCVMANQQVLPIVGRICMNHTTIDLTGSQLRVGDEVTVMSSNPNDPNSIAFLSAKHHLFSYTTLTGLSSSIRRYII